MRPSSLILPCLAVATVVFVTAPEESRGYDVNNRNLNTNERDFRLYNNFEDATANNNNTEHIRFPGYVGAELAVWKAGVEWGSQLHHTGQGDPSQPADLGSGGANFDASWQGNATGIGGITENVVSAIPGSDGGTTLAFTEYIGLTVGWRIRYYENHDWHDGPGTGVPAADEDIQGIQTHEYGHALGLGHSNNSNATMYGTASGNGVADRSIHTDDINGIQSIYGAKSASKPEISGTSIYNGKVYITGNNFSATGNQVWFTQSGAGGTGTPVKALDIPSADGTHVIADIPAGAGKGDILVKKFGGTTGDTLSNAWPDDITEEDTLAPQLTGTTPSTLCAVTNGPVILTGSRFQGFGQDATILINGQAPDYTVDSDSQITVNEMPLFSSLGSVSLDITNFWDTTNESLSIGACFPPVLTLDDTNIDQTVGVQVTVGADFADIGFLLVSPDLIPSDFGSFTLDIGNNGTTLINVGTMIVFDEGWASVFLGPFSGLSMGTQFHWQALFARSTEAYAQPWDVSNTVSSTITN